MSKLGWLEPVKCAFSTDAPDAVLTGQLQELRGQLPIIYCGMAFCSLFVAILFFDRAPLTIIAFEVAFLGIATLRVRSWNRLDPSSMSVVRKRETLRRLTWMSFAMSMLLLTIAFAIDPLARPDERIALVLFVAYCGVGCGMSLAVFKPASRIAMALPIFPYALHVATTQPGTGRVVALIILVAVPVGIRQYGRMADFFRALTERNVQSQARRKEAENRRRQFLETATDFAWESDTQNRLTYVSGQFLSFAGRPIEDLLGLSGREFARLLDMRLLSASIDPRDAFAERLAYRDAVYEMKRANGAAAYVSTSAQPHFSDDGAFLGYIGWTRDVTAEYAAQIALREGEQRFRDFAESASDWFWEADAELRYSFLSDRAAVLTGIDHGSIIGSKMGAVDGEFPKEERARFLTALSERAPFKDVISALKRPDLVKVWVAQSGVPVVAADGAFAGYRGVCRNVTAQVEAREEIEESRRRLARTNASLEDQIAQRTAEINARKEFLDDVIESMADGLVVFDEQFKIQNCNRTAIAISGLPQSLWENGRDVREVLAIGIKAGVYDYHSVDDYFDAMSRSLQETGYFTANRRQKDQRVIGEHIRIRPHGGYVATYHDITDLKSREERLEQLTANLTAARDAAEDGARAKAQFLANMSHEIRTPMNGVVGMASLLLDTGLTHKQREMAQVIVNSGDSLLMIINDILDFSRLEAGKMAIVEEPFDLRSVVEDVAALLSLKVQEKNLELMIRYSPDLGAKFIGDAGRIRQAITNLVGNAVKFTDTGHVLITVSGRARGESTDVEIAVTDTGCGVPAEKLDAIFEAFEQADGSAARRHDGTGLGLAITRRLVEAMNGEIVAESVVGAGSTFRIRIPIRIDERQTFAAPLETHMVAGLRALVVDDNKVNRDILVEQLSSWGLTVFACASAAQAMKAGRRAAKWGAPFDIAILDHQMPGEDGVALAARMRAAPAFVGAPLILLTSAGRKGDPGEMVRGLFDAYLVKPARASMFYDTIVNALGSKARGDVARTAAALRETGAAAMAAPAPDGAGSAPPCAGLKVLVAEDNVVNQMVIAAMLDSMGCLSRIVSNGVEVINAFGTFAPDVVLMDISMPEMDGAEACRRIRIMEHEAAAGPTPIIGVTAHAMKDDRERCLDAGMDDHLPKPVKQGPLLDTLRKWSATRPGEARKSA